MYVNKLTIIYVLFTHNLLHYNIHIVDAVVGTKHKVLNIEFHLNYL